MRKLLFLALSLITLSAYGQRPEYQGLSNPLFRQVDKYDKPVTNLTPIFDVLDPAPLSLGRNEHKASHVPYPGKGLGPLWNWTPDSPHHKSVVVISNGGYAGSGVKIKHDQDKGVLILTNHHVVDENAPVYVNGGYGWVKVEIIYMDEDQDLAVLWNPSTEVKTALPLGNYDVPNGTWLEVLGFGGDGRLGKTEPRHFTAKTFNSPVFRGDMSLAAPTISGDSGGPMIWKTEKERAVVGILYGGPFRDEQPPANCWSLVHPVSTHIHGKRLVEVVQGACSPYGVRPGIIYVNPTGGTSYGYCPPGSSTWGTPSAPPSSGGTNPMQPPPSVKPAPTPNPQPTPTPPTPTPSPSPSCPCNGQCECDEEKIIKDSVTATISLIKKDKSIQNLLRGERGEQGETGLTGGVGPKGPQGPPGNDYNLTDQDKIDIAKLAATIVIEEIDNRPPPVQPLPPEPEPTPVPVERYVYITADSCTACAETDQRVQELKAQGVPITVIKLTLDQAETNEVPQFHNPETNKTYSGLTDVNYHLSTIFP